MDFTVRLIYACQRIGGDPGTGGQATVTNSETGPGTGKTVVIFRLGSLGDTVAALPCFHAIARRYPDHRRVVLTNAPVAENAAPLLAVLGQTGVVHGAIAYPVGARSVSVLGALLKRLRAMKPDAIVYLAPSRGASAVLRDWLFLRLAAPVKAVTWGKDMRQCRVDPATGVMEREASRLARTIARDIGPVDLYDPKAWDLELTAGEREAADRALAPFGGKPFVTIHMGTKVPQNDWGETRWGDFLARLSEGLSERGGDTGLVVLGAPSDRERADALAPRWKGQVLVLAGDLAPRESAAVLEKARLFIGHDSGPLHMSVAVGCPSVGLFSANNPPIKWHPIGDHVRVIHRMAGIDTITVEEAYDAASDLLAQPR
ncbi:MAG: glycosyltransferase family 9 protein [Caulobacteraceae bacterium]|nr:glycosyltransferase family 9 protein [Caulobacteraceae bacterium]